MDSCVLLQVLREAGQDELAAEAEIAAWLAAGHVALRVAVRN